jgi:hypothetical protein
MERRGGLVKGIMNTSELGCALLEEEEGEEDDDDDDDDGVVECLITRTHDALRFKLLSLLFLLQSDIDEEVVKTERSSQKRIKPSEDDVSRCIVPESVIYLFFFFFGKKIK